MIGLEIKLKQIIDLEHASEGLYYKVMSEPYVTSTMYKKAVTCIVVASLRTGKINEIMISQIDRELSEADIDLEASPPPPIKRRIRERQSSKNNKY